MLQEPSEAQNDRLAAQYRKVTQYLSTMADQRDAERRRNWALPEGITPEEYQEKQEPFRVAVARMIGYPPPGTQLEAAPQLEEIGQDEDGTFYRVTLPLLQEGLEAYGLLIVPTAANAKAGKPLAVAIHGGGGTPELAAGILDRGSANYNDMGRRLARRGHVVWMPACYERTSFDEEVRAQTDVHQTLNQRAILVGSTLPALDAFSILRSTRALLGTEHVPATRAIAVGLSYGGYRTLLVTALSSLFVGCISSCIFNDRRKRSEEGHLPDLLFPNLLGIATDVEYCQLICPRPLYIEMGISDDLVPVADTRRPEEEVRRVYQALGIEERFGFETFTGGHEFSGTNAFAFLDRMGL
jgi:dienelactone hydrolase